MINENEKKFVTSFNLKKRRVKKMTKLIRNNQKGFTLIELMIVVAIIGILAAIAIPNFLNYQLKSKTAEAKTNIGAIKTSQEAFKAEHDFYATCVENPALATVGPAKQSWTAAAPAAGDGWLEIGFAPSGDVYYSYEVAIGGTTNTVAIQGIAIGSCGDAMSIGAAGNLDGDATNGEFGFRVDSVAAVAAAKPGVLSANPVANNTLEDMVPGSF
jgi:type IV pilus assembly protein PilA